MGVMTNMMVTILDAVTATKQELMLVETKGESVVHLSNAIQILSRLEIVLQDEDTTQNDTPTEDEDKE